MGMGGEISEQVERDQEAEPSGFTLPAHSNSSKTRERDGTQHKGTWEHTHTQGKTTRGGREGASRPPHTKEMDELDPDDLTNDNLRRQGEEVVAT